MTLDDQRPPNSIILEEESGKMSFESQSTKKKHIVPKLCDLGDSVDLRPKSSKSLVPETSQIISGNSKSFNDKGTEYIKDLYL